MGDSRVEDETRRLVADVGGTNARFAIAGRRGGLRQTKVVACATFVSLSDALADYLAGLQSGPPLRTAVIAVACPVTGDRIEMTNRAWSFSANRLRRRFRFQQLTVINDFAGLALSIPHLATRHKPVVKAGKAVRGAPIAVIGPGTGLGVAGLIPAGDRWVPLASEGGHRDVAATTEREWAVLQVLRRRFRTVSVERIVSGPGLVNIYRALAQLDGSEPQPFDPAAVVSHAQRGHDRLCGEAVAMFAEQLGAAAGDLALTLGARGGVYLGGGMVQKMGQAFDAGKFAKRFVDKGRFAKYLAPVPVRLITHPTPALLGAARYDPSPM